VTDAVHAAGDKYVGFSGHDPVAGTALQRLALSPSFKNLCMGIVERAIGRRPPDEAYYQILRCLAGAKDQQQHSMRFHYDTYVLTALFPIHVPAGKNSGELIVLPNFRKLRSSYAANFVDKVLLDNSLTQKFLKRLSDRGSSGSPGSRAISISSGATGASIPMRHAMPTRSAPLRSTIILIRTRPAGSSGCLAGDVRDDPPMA
jgi:hypothetical protein